MTHEALAKQAARAAYWVGPSAELGGRARPAGEGGRSRRGRRPGGSAIWYRRRRSRSLLTPPRVERLTSRAAIAACRGFAPPGFAEWLIDRGPRPAGGRCGEPGRRRTDRAVGPRLCASDPGERDLVLAIIQERAARLVRVPVDYHEPPNVISYEPGQEFGLHADYIDPRVPEFQRELQSMGQRTVTILTYLNTDFEGAETLLPRCRSKVRGGVGDAIVCRQRAGRTGRRISTPAIAACRRRAAANGCSRNG